MVWFWYVPSQHTVIHGMKCTMCPKTTTNSARGERRTQQAGALEEVSHGLPASPGHESSTASKRKQMVQKMPHDPNSPPNKGKHKQQRILSVRNSTEQIRCRHHRVQPRLGLPFQLRRQRNSSTNSRIPTTDNDTGVGPYCRTPSPSGTRVGSPKQRHIKSSIAPYRPMVAR